MTCRFFVFAILIVPLSDATRPSGASAQEAVDELQRALDRLTAPKDFQRVRAARSLGEMGADAQPAYEALMELALSDDLPKVRRAAVEALAKIDRDRADKQLVETLESSDSAQIRARAVDASAILHTSNALRPLFKALRDESDTVRRRAATALQKYKNSEMLAQWLIDALPRQDDKARLAAPWLLAYMKHQPAVEPLITALNDEDLTFRLAVVASLRSFGDTKAVEPLVDLVEREKDADVRAQAIQVLGELGDRRAAKPLLRFLQDSDREVREAAAFALGELRVREAIPALRKMLEQEGGLAEMAALCQLGDQQAIPLIVKTINRLQARDVELLRWPMSFLAVLEAEIELAALSRHDDDNIKTAALATLHELATAQVVERVRKILPKGWDYASNRAGKVTPTNWPEGMGEELRFRHERVSPEGRRAVDAEVHLWVMRHDYAARCQKPANALEAGDPRAAAVELPARHGCRIFVWSTGGTEWPSKIDDVRAALAASESKDNATGLRSDR